MLILMAKLERRVYRGDFILGFGVMLVVSNKFHFPNIVFIPRKPNIAIRRDFFMVVCFGDGCFHIVGVKFTTCNNMLETNFVMGKDVIEVIGGDVVG